MTPENKAKNEQTEGALGTAEKTLPTRSIEDLATLVRLHLKTLEMNGEKTCEVLKKAAADTAAEYEAALSANMADLEDF